MSVEPERPSPWVAALPSFAAPLVQRHVQDAAFYWQQLDTAPQEPGLRAERLQHFARLLAAHLEGLTVAGSAAWPEALAALQRWRKPGEAFAASHVALNLADAEAQAALLAQVARHPDLLLRGLIGGLMAAPPGPVQRFNEAAWVLMGSDAKPDQVQLVAALRSCALRGTEVPPTVMAAVLTHTTPAVRAAACRASKGAASLLSLLQDGDLCVRAEAAIALGPQSTAAVNVLLQAVLAQAQVCKQATGWTRTQAQRRLARWLRHLAWLMNPTEQQHEVASLLGQLPLREALRFTLFLGDPAHLGFVLKALDDEEQARWAGFVWQSLTGVDLTEQGLTSPEPPVDLDAGLTRARQDGDQGLPLPDAQAVRAHPVNATLALRAGHRVLLGQDLTPARLATLLRIESNQPQLLRAVAAQAWNAQVRQSQSPETALRIQLRAGAIALLAQDQALANRS